jgi:hypothetical protein
MEWPIARWPRKPPEQVYIRFGRWSSQSRNYSTRDYERGVSVCPARLNPDLTVSLLLDECDPSWFDQLRGQGRLVFPVTGRAVGLGSDGEPVLRAVRCLPYAVDFRSIPDLR